MPHQLFFGCRGVARSKFIYLDNAMAATAQYALNRFHSNTVPDLHLSHEDESIVSVQLLRLSLIA